MWITRTFISWLRSRGLFLAAALVWTSFTLPPAARADVSTEDLRIITEVFCQRGRDLARLQDWRGSAEAFGEALLRNPGNTDALFGQGYALYRSNDLVGAKESLRRALESDPEHTSSRLWLGMILLQEKDLDGARKMFEELLEAEVTDPRACFGLASVHEELYKRDRSPHDREVAERYFQHYLRETRNSSGPGTEYAATANARLLELKFGKVGRTFNQALAAFEKGEYEEANRLLTLVLEMDPHFQKAHLLKAKLCTTGGTPVFDPGLDRCIEALEKAPDEPEARCMLGSLYMVLGKDERARANLQAALRLDPTNQKALNLLAELSQKAGDLERALEAYRKSKDINPESPEGRKAKVELDVVMGVSQGTQVLCNSSEEKRGKIEAQGIVTDAYLTARVNAILERIVRRNHFPYLWEKYVLRIINNSSMQAYSLPGGHLYINVGLIQLVRDRHQDSEDVLAFILAHEIAHIEQDHVVASLRHVEALGGKLEVLPRVRTVLAAFQRSDEFEADCLGTRYAYAAGYDPFSGIAFLQERLRDGTFLDEKDHAVMEERLQRLHSCLGELRGYCRSFENGLTLLAEEDYAGARKDFETFLFGFPGDPAARNNMAVALHKQALCCTKPALWWKTSDIEPIRLRALQRKQRSRTRSCSEAECNATALEAERQFKILLAANQGDEAALNNLATLHQDFGRTEQASVLYEEALSLNPNYVEARNNYGVLLCETNQYNAGIEHLKNAIRMDPSFLPARYNLGKAYFKLGNDAAAVETWAAYLSRDKNPSAWILRAKRFSAEARARLAKDRPEGR